MNISFIKTFALSKLSANGKFIKYWCINNRVRFIDVFVQHNLVLTRASKLHMQNSLKIVQYTETHNYYIQEQVKRAVTRVGEPTSHIAFNFLERDLAFVSLLIDKHSKHRNCC